MVAKSATATFLTKLCSKKFTIRWKKSSIAKSSAWAVITPHWLRTFFSSFQRQRQSVIFNPAKYFPPDIAQGCTCISGYTTGMAMVASWFPVKDNTTSTDFPNYSRPGSRYSVLGISFSLSSTPCPPNIVIIPQNYTFWPTFWGDYNEVLQFFCPFFCRLLIVKIYWIAVDCGL